MGIHPPLLYHILSRLSRGMGNFFLGAACAFLVMGAVKLIMAIVQTIREKRK